MRWIAAQPHGYFSAGYEPVVTIDPGETIGFSTLEAGWGTGPHTGRVTTTTGRGRRGGSGGSGMR
jgi:hypothetical protein